MMWLLRFLFPFLFIRNWETGEVEFSRPRLFWFIIGIGFLVLGLIFIALLQRPVVYAV